MRAVDLDDLGGEDGVAVSRQLAQPRMTRLGVPAKEDIAWSGHGYHWVTQRCNSGSAVEVVGPV